MGFQYVSVSLENFEVRNGDVILQMHCVFVQILAPSQSNIIVVFSFNEQNRIESSVLGVVDFFDLSAASVIDEQDMLDVALGLEFRVLIEVLLREVFASLLVAQWEVQFPLEDCSVWDVAKVTYVSFDQTLFLELRLERLGRSDPQTSCGHSA